MIKLDLGCGFDESVGQVSLKDAIGIDLNFMYGKSTVAHPIMGDVNLIPIRSSSICFIHAHAILEHLPRPQLCLNEMKRVMKSGATGSILLPTNSYTIFMILMRFIKEFPFTIIWTIKKLMRTMTLWKIPGLVHVSQIDIEDIEKWFKVDHDKIRYIRRINKWFIHIAPFTYLSKIGLIRRLEVDEYEEVVIPICAC